MEQVQKNEQNVKSNEKNVESNYKNNQLINNYESLEKYLPHRVFESVRQIFYGNKAQ